jgi:ATP-dependent Lhr-like helicase
LLARGELLLRRFGVLTREGVESAGVEGGFGQVYPLLRNLEEAGKIRRGYFIAAEGPDAIGANQFAWPGAESRLRNHRDPRPEQALTWLASSDPANAYGSVLAWPAHVDTRPARSVGSVVVLDDGRLLAWLSKDRSRICLYPSSNWATDASLPRLARLLVDQFELSGERAWLLEVIDTLPARELASGAGEPAHSAAQALVGALLGLGFRAGHAGLQKLREARA